MVFGIANMAGAYAAMTRTAQDEEIAVIKIMGGEYHEAGIKEDQALIAKANVTGGKRWVDRKGRIHQEIVARETVRNKKGDMKAEFTLSYAVVPRAVLEKIINTLKEKGKE
jgi:hypothetical protein